MTTRNRNTRTAPKTTAPKAPKASTAPKAPKAPKLPTLPPPAPINAGEALDRTTCLVLKRGSFGNRRKASTKTITVDADKALLGVTKTLLDSPELVEIAKLDSEVQTYISNICLPSLFKNGVWLVPLALTEEVDQELETFASRRRELVEAAKTVYPMRMAETAARLGTLSEMKDYPSAERFAATFYMEWSYVAFQTPSSLQEVSAGLFERERDKAAARMNTVAAACETAMLTGLQDLVAKMVERLTPDPETGKPRRFHASLVSNFTEFLRTVDMRNITSNEALTTLATNARALLTGVSADTLRTDDLVRQRVADGFSAIATTLTPIVATRSIAFDDEA